MRKHPTDDRRPDTDRPETDASAGWRTEYHYQHAPDPERQLRADGGERPDGCMCWDATLSPPCFPCAAAGFERQNPEPPEADDDVEDTAPADRQAEAEAATDGGTSVPDTHLLAERLGVRTDHLLSFIQNHPDPTPPIVLGWATDTGDPQGPPEDLRDLLTEWLVVKGRRADLRTGSMYRAPEAGDVVEDREAAEDGELVIIKTHLDTAAADYQISEINSTVAEVNPEYADAAPVVEAVYRDEVEGQLDEWTLGEICEAVASGAIGSYAFPADRLVAGGDTQ